MKETIYNLYAFVTDGIISKVAIAPRDYFKPLITKEEVKEGDSFLAAHAAKDLAGASHHPVPENYKVTDLFSLEDDLRTGMPYEVYKSMVKRGDYEVIGIYEEAFEAVNAPLRPFVYYSVVENNTIVYQHN